MPDPAISPCDLSPHSDIFACLLEPVEQILPKVMLGPLSTKDLTPLAFGCSFSDFCPHHAAAKNNFSQMPTGFLTRLR